MLFSFPMLHAPPVADHWPNFALRNIDTKIMDVGIPMTNFVVGLDAAMYQSEAMVIDKSNNQDTQFRVKENTGFSVVIPAWEILELLLTNQTFVKQRKDMDKETIKADANNPVVGASADYADDSEKIEVEMDFAALTKASQPFEPFDSETKET